MADLELQCIFSTRQIKNHFFPTCRHHNTICSTQTHTPTHGPADRSLPHSTTSSHLHTTLPNPPLQLRKMAINIKPAHHISSAFPLHNTIIQPKTRHSWTTNLPIHPLLLHAFKIDGKAANSDFFALRIVLYDVCDGGFLVDAIGEDGDVAYARWVFPEEGGEC